MSCLPLAKCLRRILRKMLPTSRKLSEEKLLIDSDKENARLDDTSSYFPSPSSSSRTYFGSWRSSTEMSSFVEVNNTFNVGPTNLNNFSNSPPYNSSHSSGYESSLTESPKLPFWIFKDQSTAFDSVISSSKRFKTNDKASSLTQSSQSISYSPLSSFNSSHQKTSNDFYSIFNFDELSLSLQAENQEFHDALRLDFESNGKTLELNDALTFSPPISSTPMPNRRQQTNNQQQRFKRNLPAEPEWSKNKKIPRPRFKPNKKSLEDHCVFCKNNGADKSVYNKHTVKDSMGRVLCPILRDYKCPICGVNGDKSHTIKYCPMRKIITHEDIARMNNKV